MNTITLDRPIASTNTLERHTHTDEKQLVERASALVPALRARHGETDLLCKAGPETAAALEEINIFGIGLPRDPEKPGRLAQDAGGPGARGVQPGLEQPRSSRLVLRPCRRVFSACPP